MSTKYRVYEVVCLDKRIKDRYIGYTSMTKTVFINCQNGIDKDGKEIENKQPPSRLQAFVMDHGGWDNWDFRVIGKVRPTRQHAEVLKERILMKHSDRYTLNIYGTKRKRAPPTKRDDDSDDSDEESVATED